MDLGRASVRDRPGVVQGRGTGQVHVQAQWLMYVLPRHRTQRPGSSSQRDGMCTGGWRGAAGALYSAGSIENPGGQGSEFWE